MEKYFDKIFEKVFSAHEAELWYKARDYVVNRVLPIDGDGIGPGDKKHVHIVVEGIKEDMLAVVRQLCLLTHYPNFNEASGANRTIITFCTDQKKEDIKEKVFKTDIFGKLLEYCEWAIKDEKGEVIDDKVFNKKENEYFPLDIEFEFTKTDIKEFEKHKEEQTNKHEYITIIKSSDVNEFFEKDSKLTKEGIDVSKGMLVNMVYCTGATIDNLPAFDNENIDRYSTALNVFCYNLKHEEIEKKWKGSAKIQDDGTYKGVDIKNQLSSIFCADCFESRLKGIHDTKKKTVYEYLLTDFETVMETIRDKKTINALVRCEHARWNVERLIMGYQPLSAIELYEIECLFGQERKDKIKDYKSNLKHIDLCSNKDLRRLNPADVKYDYFLMLAMPQIVLSSIR